MTGLDQRDAAISVRALCKRYGEVAALDGVEFDVPKGTVMGLLGPNGAGKTTIVRILATVLAPDSGTVRVGGVDALADPGRARYLLRMAGQAATVDDRLTGRENLLLVGLLCQLGRGRGRQEAASLLERFDLCDAADRLVGTYSGGMRRRLDLAASLIGGPEVLVLDEPTTGLDPRARAGLWDVVDGLVDDGTTVVLTTQYLEEAERLAHRIVVVDQGQVIAQGTATELKGGHDSMLELIYADGPTASRAVEALTKSGRRPSWKADSETVTVPVPGDSATVLRVLQQLQEAAATSITFQLRKPSLDDVFLSLTDRGPGSPS
jgi:ABC-2 type transport system ATP-binding protein